MRVLILGAGRNQAGLIKKAVDNGHEVMVCDYLADAPGRKLAHRAFTVSTLDREKVFKVAIEQKVGAILTVGTDQPVEVAAWVSERLGLPYPVSHQVAYTCTNKLAMKAVYEKHGIPAPRHREISGANQCEQLMTAVEDLGGLPVVVKPADNQGQRGIYLLRNLELAPSLIADSLRHTRRDSVLLEEYIKGQELTISAWVKAGQVYPLLITDRPLLAIEPHLGLPTAHIFPSRFYTERSKELEEFAQAVVTAFAIKEGPVYLQIMVEEDGRLVMNEVACRVGGGHEDRLLLELYGFDILQAVLDLATTGKHPELADIKQPAAQAAAIKFLFGEPGSVAAVEGLKMASQVPGVKEIVFYNPNLSEVPELTDSTRRLGYILLEAKDYHGLEDTLRMVFNQLILRGSGGDNRFRFKEIKD